MMSQLICFETVEWHRSERMLFQFGIHSGIPPILLCRVLEINRLFKKKILI